ncbi:hypothetical protein NA57DRAFT_73989 [Rhizodiscina lignyota]|uniref:Signal recognition particle subunit SRP72 n=1 Tax=Rhizodiscina lignyota TaxID=1504668 RepID=A0A9P4M7F6_9PEZI|nr:hypothetical protein NA57DRAFT_73989 [Rhizodiscina lignyota]
MSSGAPTLSSLLAHADIVDHEEILKAANASLRKSKSDLQAQHVRVVALLKLDRFDDALRALEEGGDKLKEASQIEWAYALYKSGNWEDAINVAREGLETGDRGLLYVLAQTSYRLEEFEQAKQVYVELRNRIREAQHEENDLRINSGAVDAQLEWKGQGHLVTQKKPGREDLEAFETAYNAACGSIARGELAQGEVLLRRAKDLCNASDELSDEEKKAELLPIMVQHVFVLVRQGRLEEAEKLSSEISSSDIPDISTRHIAQVNGLTTSISPANPYLSHRLFHSVPNFPKSDQPFDYQSLVLKQDSYVLDLLSLKLNGVAKSTSNYLSTNPSATISPAINSISVINAAATAEGATGKAGIKAILPLLEKRSNDIGLLLMVVQLYVLTNNHGSAISLLESFLSRLEQSSTPADQDVRFAPGLVGTLVSLYSSQSRRAHVKQELAKAAAYWREKFKSRSDKGGSSGVLSLLKAAGTELLNSANATDIEASRAIFTELHDTQPSDPAALAGMIASHPSGSDGSEADALPAASRLVAGIDAAALENAGVAALPLPSNVAVKRPAEKAAKEGKREEPVKKKRKLTAKRTPKDFVEGKDMDPERWLPMRDRSYYRPKGRKGKGRMAGGTQGGIVEEAKPAPSSGGGGGGGGGGQKKKGKKGKR